MKMRALDSFYSSETGQAHAGREFEVESDDRGREFAKRGLAEILEDDVSQTKPEIKAAEPPLNKAETKPVNKAALKPEAKGAHKA